MRVRVKNFLVCGALLWVLGAADGLAPEDVDFQKFVRPPLPVLVNWEGSPDTIRLIKILNDTLCRELTRNFAVTSVSYITGVNVALQQNVPIFVGLSYDANGAMLGEMMDPAVVAWDNGDQLYSTWMEGDRIVPRALIAIDCSCEPPVPDIDKVEHFTLICLKAFQDPTTLIQRLTSLMKASDLYSRKHSPLCYDKPDPYASCISITINPWPAVEDFLMRRTGRSEPDCEADVTPVMWTTPHCWPSEPTRKDHEFCTFNAVTCCDNQGRFLIHSPVPDSSIRVLRHHAVSWTHLHALEFGVTTTPYDIRACSIVVDEAYVYAKGFDDGHFGHYIHDSLAPLFHTMMSVSLRMGRGRQINRDSLLVAWYRPERKPFHDFLLPLFSNHAEVYLEDLRQRGVTVCFEEVTVGNDAEITLPDRRPITLPEDSREAMWVDYTNFLIESLIDTEASPAPPLEPLFDTHCPVRVANALLAPAVSYRFQLRPVSAVDKSFERTRPTLLEGLTVVWVTRPPGRRAILNELDLVAYMESAGATVHVIAFERLDLPETVALMQKSDILLGIYGNGLHNGIFLPPRAVIGCIFPFSINDADINTFTTQLLALSGRTVVYLWEPCPAPACDQPYRGVHGNFKKNDVTRDIEVRLPDFARMFARMVFGLGHDFGLAQRRQNTWLPPRKLQLMPSGAARYPEVWELVSFLV